MKIKVKFTSTSQSSYTYVSHSLSLNIRSLTSFHPHPSYTHTQTHTHTHTHTHTTSPTHPHPHVSSFAFLFSVSTDLVLQFSKWGLCCSDRLLFIYSPGLISSSTSGHQKYVNLSEVIVISYGIELTRRAGIFKSELIGCFLINKRKTKQNRKERFWLGHDEHLNLTQRLNLSDLNLSG